MRRPALRAALACGFAILVGSIPAGAQPFVPALAGQVAPDTGGGTYASFGFLDVNSVGEVVFSATVSGGSVPGGLFTARRPLALNHRAIARIGDVVPGNPYPFPVTFAEFRGATIIYGQVAFLATFDVPGGAGIFVANLGTGAITLLAKVGGLSPTGQPFQELRVPSNRCGDVVFAGTAGVTRGIFRSAGGVLSTVVLEGDPAPDLEPYTFASFGDPSCASASQNRIAFSAVVEFEGDSASGFFRYTGGVGEILAQQYAASPDGVAYGAFSSDSPGENGIVSSFGFTDGSGLFLAMQIGPNGKVVLARLGQTAPRTGGGTFAAFPHSPALRTGDHGMGGVAVAQVSGGTASSGVFAMFWPSAGFPVAVSAPAVVGDPAPETGGGTYSAFSRPAAANALIPFLALEEEGVIAFRADVAGGTASSGIFVLPEPGALAAQLAGAVLLTLLRDARKRA